MAVGQPDWTTKQYQMEVTPRARQIWPTGKVVWSSDFETTWSGISISAGTVTYRVISEYGNSGGNCLQLLTSADAAVSGTVYRHFGPVASGRYGVEITFGCDQAITTFAIGLYVRKDSVYYYGRINISPGGGVLQYWDSAGNWQTVPGTYTFPLGDVYVWQRMKFTIDLNTGKYGKFWIDDLEFDLSAFDIQTGAGGAWNVAQCRIEVMPSIPVQRGIYIDDWVITEE